VNHGHVRPRPDGTAARCGGPTTCHTCRADAWEAGWLRHAVDCQMLRHPPPGWPFDGFSCNCNGVFTEDALRLIKENPS
jgi:hypothetical protein